MGHLQKGLNVFGSNVLAQCGSVGLGWSKPPCRSSTATHSVMHRRYALNSPGQEPKSRFFDSYVTVHIVHVEHVHVNDGVAQTGGPPITAAQETMFRFLALLYPSPPRPSPSQEMIEEHPFSTDWPYPYIVGNPNYPEPES
jgi:hypothetical protein